MRNDLTHMQKQFSDIFDFFSCNKIFIFSFWDVNEIFRPKILTKNLVVLRFHSNSDLHTFQKILWKLKINSLEKKNLEKIFPAKYFRFFLLEILSRKKPKLVYNIAMDIVFSSIFRFVRCNIITNLVLTPSLFWGN